VTGPLIFTTACWRNAPRTRADGTVKMEKILAHSGHGILTGGYFRYGTHTPSHWRTGDLQTGLICNPESGLIVIDVDDETEYLTTQVSRHIGRGHATTVRGDHFHCWLDARDIPREHWPTQGPISGTDHVKSCGFVPVPGSVHYSGQRYELAPGTRWERVTIATPEMIRALVADRTRMNPGSGRMGITVTAAREAGAALLQELQADTRPSCPETGRALAWALERLGEAEQGQRHKWLTAGLRRLAELGVDGHVGITAAADAVCDRWDQLTAGEAREDEAGAIELWAACKAAARPRVPHDPCEMLLAIARRQGWAS
jgi:hypothetical protein